MDQHEQGMKVYLQVLNSARVNGHIPKDTRGHWDYYPKGYTPPTPEQRAKELAEKKTREKARAAAKRAAKKAAKEGRKVEKPAEKEASPKLSEAELRKKLHKQEMKRLTQGAWNAGCIDHIKSVGNGL